jgi:hypothetical protein
VRDLVTLSRTIDYIAYHLVDKDMEDQDVRFEAIGLRGRDISLYEIYL